MVLLRGDTASLGNFSLTGNKFLLLWIYKAISGTTQVHLLQFSCELCVKQYEYRSKFAIFEK